MKSILQLSPDAAVKDIPDVIAELWIILKNSYLS